MNRTDNDILDNLKNVRWDIAARTYGNNHATLVGLLVHWWVCLEPNEHQTAESGPSYGKFTKGVGGGMCDAVLCKGADAIGILEVEGTRPEYTIEKIGKFFGSTLADLKSLRFAVVVLYPTGPRGRGPERAMPSCWNTRICSLVTEVSRAYPDKQIIAVTLDKAYERDVEGIRRRTDYYKSRLSMVRGFLYAAGKEVAHETLWSEPR